MSSPPGVQGIYTLCLLQKTLGCCTCRDHHSQHPQSPILNVGGFQSPVQYSLHVSTGAPAAHLRDAEQKGEGCLPALLAPVLETLSSGSSGGLGMVAALQAGTWVSRDSTSAGDEWWPYGVRRRFLKNGGLLARPEPWHVVEAQGPNK